MAAAKVYVIFVVTILFHCALRGQCNIGMALSAKLCPEPYFTSKEEHIRKLKNLLDEGTTTNGPSLQETTSASKELTDYVSTIKRDSTTNKQSLQGWSVWEDNYYKFVNISYNWDEAVKACETYHKDAHLAFIETDEEMKYIYHAIKITSVRTWWIGMHDKNVEGLWEWYDTPSSYTNWSPEQPDNYDDGEHCCEIYGGTGLWNDMTCVAQLYFICEI